jgi:hypothetical protein
MITTSAKWFLGLGVVSFVLAAAYGYSTGGTRLGPITAGYYGGVGDHLGYTILITLGLGAALLGLIAVLTRDANPSALAELAGTDEAPAAVAPTFPSQWPVVAAFGAALVALGLVISNVLFMVGAFVLLAVLVEWMVLAWSDRATGDPETNRLVRRRVMAPFEVPLAGFLVVAVVVIAISRLLLTSSSLGAVAVACVAAVVILGVGILLAMRPTISPNVVAGLLTVLALGVVAAGVASAARGERFIERHEEHPAEGEEGEEGEHEGQSEDESEGNTVFMPEGTDPATTTTAPAEGEG